MTAKQAVEKKLRSRRWIKGYDLQKVGGSEALRRVRELRADGAEIKMRRIPGSTAFEYRMIKAP